MKNELTHVSSSDVKCPRCGARPVRKVSFSVLPATKCKCSERKALARRVSAILAAHFTVAERPCNGDAHSPHVNGQIDHCMVCLPRWGTIEYLAPAI